MRSVDNFDYGKLVDQNPGLSKWLQNPDNAVLSQNETAQLAELEKNSRFILPSAAAREPGFFKDFNTSKNLRNAVFSVVMAQAEIERSPILTGVNDLGAAVTAESVAMGIMNPEIGAQVASQFAARAESIRERAPTHAKKFQAAIQDESSAINESVRKAIHSMTSISREKRD